LLVISIHNCIHLLIYKYHMLAWQIWLVTRVIRKY